MINIQNRFVRIGLVLLFVGSVFLVGYQVALAFTTTTIKLTGSNKYTLHIYDMTGETEIQQVTLPPTTGRNGEVHVIRVINLEPDVPFVQFVHAPGDSFENGAVETTLHMNQDIVKTIVADDTNYTWWMIGEDLINY